MKYLSERTRTISEKYVIGEIDQKLLFNAFSFVLMFTINKHNFHKLNISNSSFSHSMFGEEGL
jgi:hypothetical protein